MTRQPPRMSRADLRPSAKRPSYTRGAMRRAPDELARIDRLFDDALALSPDDRQIFLERIERNEPLLAVDVRALLQAAEQPEGTALWRAAIDDGWQGIASRTRRRDVRRRADRRLSHRAPARPRRHGAGLSRRARRRRLHAAGGAQAGHPRSVRRRRARPVLARTPDPRAPQSSAHRPAAGWRRGRARPLVHRDGARRRRADRSLLRRRAAVDRCAARGVRPGRRRGPVRPPQPDRPSRSEADQYPGDA